MKDDKLIKDYHLDKTCKRIQNIYEYTFITKPVLSEEDDIENTEQQDDTMNINSNPEDSNQQDTNIGDDMSVSNSDNEDNAQNIELENNNETESGVNDFENIDTMQDGDEVIDVDDLTQSQEVSQYKIDDVDDKISTLLQVVDKFMTAIEQNDQKIEDLKSEFEKRNPTKEEILNLRSLSSYPFSVSPKKYFDEKSESNNNYNFQDRNDVSPQEEIYQFTKKDLKNVNDKELSRTLDDEQKLSDYINF